jgi:hypothetical protein
MCLKQHLVFSSKEHKERDGTVSLDIVIVSICNTKANGTVPLAYFLTRLLEWKGARVSRRESFFSLSASAPNQHTFETIDQ